MPPKKSGKKKKEPELQEPEHDASWEKAVQSGLWELPPTSLPDANTWPTWGALRERILTAAKQINILGSAAVRDNFLSELVKLSPPELHTLGLRGSVNISKAVISPTSACPKLAHLDLNGCPKLSHVLIQSQSLLTLNLTNCTHLTKVIIQCPNLEKFDAKGCTSLEVLMLWSEKLTELDITDSKDCKASGDWWRLWHVMTKRDLHCPNLLIHKVATLVPPPRPIKPVHPPIADIIRAYPWLVLSKSRVLAMMQDHRHDAEEEKGHMEQEFRNSAETKTTIPAMWRPLA